MILIPVYSSSAAVQSLVQIGTTGYDTKMVRVSNGTIPKAWDKKIHCMIDLFIYIVYDLFVCDSYISFVVNDLKRCAILSTVDNNYPATAFEVSVFHRCNMVEVIAQWLPCERVEVTCLVSPIFQFPGSGLTK